MLTTIILALAAGLVVAFAAKGFVSSRDTARRRILSAVALRRRVHPRDMAPELGLPPERVRKHMERLRRQGYLVSEEVESSGHYWGDRKQRYYALSQRGRDER